MSIKIDHDRRTIYLFGPQNFDSDELQCAGKMMLIPMSGPELLQFKFHSIYGITKAGYTWYGYVPLPKDKKHLELFLREVAENEGIDLTSPGS